MKRATLIILMVGAFVVLVSVALLSYIVRKGDDGIKEGSPAYARLVKRIRAEEKQKLHDEGCEDCRKQKELTITENGIKEELEV